MCRTWLRDTVSGIILPKSFGSSCRHHPMRAQTGKSRLPRRRGHEIQTDHAPPSNRWHFVAGLLSSSSAVCRRAYAAAVRTLCALPPQEGNGQTSKQDLEAGTRSRRWTWAFWISSNRPARKFLARPRPPPLPPRKGSRRPKSMVSIGRTSRPNPRRTKSSSRAAPPRRKQPRRSRRRPAIRWARRRPRRSRGRR